jgi:hypothetical protein
MVVKSTAKRVKSGLEISISEKFPHAELMSFYSTGLLVGIDRSDGWVQKQQLPDPIELSSLDSC